MLGFAMGVMLRHVFSFSFLIRSIYVGAPTGFGGPTVRYTLRPLLQSTYEKSLD
eukprot:SAG31_NODE_1256_length_9081_cov_13.160655_6_plen_54_part_00